MAYLFDKEVEEVLKHDSKNPNLLQVKSECEKVTKALLLIHARTGTYSASDGQAANLAKTMGTKAGNSPHAKDYVDNWRQVSDNVGTIFAKVSGELANAHKLGLDIRHFEVVGKMYYLATYIWSVMDSYSGPSDGQNMRR